MAGHSTIIVYYGFRSRLRRTMMVGGSALCGRLWTWTRERPEIE